MRAPADAGERCVEAANTDLQRRGHVRQRQPARVVEMAAPEAIPGDAQDLFEQLAHHARIGVSNRVGEAHAVSAGIQQRLHEAQNLGTIHVTLQGASERSADSSFDDSPRACGIAQRANTRDLGHYLVRRLAQVREAVRVTRGQRHDQQIGLTFDRALRAFEVRHQNGSEQSGQRLGVRKNLCGVGKLREQPRRNERADLHLAQTRGMPPFDPCALAPGGKNRADALQAVAQTHFANHDGRWYCSALHEFSKGIR